MKKAQKWIGTLNFLLYKQLLDFLFSIFYSLTNRLLAWNAPKFANFADFPPHRALCDMRAYKINRPICGFSLCIARKKLSAKKLTKKNSLSSHFWVQYSIYCVYYTKKLVMFFRAKKRGGALNGETKPRNWCSVGVKKKLKKKKMKNTKFL